MVPDQQAEFLKSPTPRSVFRDPTSLANQARGFLCVSVFAALMGIQHHARAYRSFSETGESLASPEVWGFRIFLGLAALITAVVVSRWIYRANSNARALGAAEMAFTPGGAVGWYFVPIANFWKPYQAMREIWKANASPSGWQRQRVSALLPCWWLLTIAAPSTAGWVTWAVRRGMDGIDEGAAEHLGEAGIPGCPDSGKPAPARDHQQGPSHADDALPAAALGGNPAVGGIRGGERARRGLNGALRSVRRRLSDLVGPAQFHRGAVAHHFGATPAHFG